MKPAHARLFEAACAEQDIIRGAVLRCGVDRADVADVCQLALIAVWQLIKADRLVIAEGRDVRTAVRGWVREVAWYTTLRSLHGPERGVEPLNEDDDRAAGPDPVVRFEARERLRIVGYRLNRDERTLLDAVGRGESALEISKRTRTPLGTVYTRLRALRRVLRKQVPR